MFKNMESNSRIFEIFQKSEGPNPGFLTYFQKYGGPNPGLLKYFQNYDVQVFDVYTNPRLGPEYGFRNGIFTRSRSF